MNSSADDPENTDESSSFYGRILVLANRTFGVKSDETNGFFSDERREEFDKKLTESQQAEARDFEKKIMRGLIEKFEATEPDSHAVVALRENLAQGIAPEIISDTAKLGVLKASELGITDYASILIESVVESFTGGGGEVYDQTNLGLFGRIQANIAERGSQKYADAMYADMLKYAAEKGANAEVERIKKLVSKHDIRGAAFEAVADKVGLTVESSQLVGVYRPKDTEGPAVS